MEIYHNLLILVDYISSQIKYEIRQQNITLNELAGKLEMTPMLLKQIVLENKIPTLRELVSIANALGKNISFIWEDK